MPARLPVRVGNLLMSPHVQACGTSRLEPVQASALFRSRVREGGGHAQLESAGVAAVRSMPALPTSIDRFPEPAAQRPCPARLDLVTAAGDTDGQADGNQADKSET